MTSGGVTFDACIGRQRTIEDTSRHPFGEKENDEVEVDRKLFRVS